MGGAGAGAKEQEQKRKSEGEEMEKQTKPNCSNSPMEPLKRRRGCLAEKDWGTYDGNHHRILV